MKRTLIKVILFSVMVLPATRCLAEPAPVDSRAYLIGHSLMTYPAILRDLAGAAGIGLATRAQKGSGFSLKSNWNLSDQAFEGDAFSELSEHVYDSLILTERVVPLEKSVEEDESAVYGRRFLDLARQTSPDIQPYLYETWHGFWERNWRERLTNDLALWEEIADGIDAGQKGKPVLIIPAGQAMARIHDAIAAGTMPGLSSIHDLFSDEIHLNNAGDYFVSLVHFTTMFRRSPVGLPAMYVSRETAAAMQELVLDVVTGYPRTGYTGQD